MPSDRYRILELALESLEIKKKRIDQEIAELKRELRRKPAPKASPGAAGGKAAAAPAKKKPHFSKEERLRRSQRMKARWENWRKKKTKTQ